MTVLAAVLLAFGFTVRTAPAAELSGGGFAVQGSVYGSGSVVSGAGLGVNFTGIFLDAPGCGAGMDLLGGNLSLTCGMPVLGPYERVVSHRIVPPSSPISLFIPAYSAPTDFDMLVNPSPLDAPLRVDPGDILAANSKLNMRNAGSAVIPQTVREFNLVTDDGNYHDAGLPLTSTLSLSYDDADDDGMVDGTQTRAQNLELWWLDETRQLWVRVPGSSVDAAAKTVSAPISHFSVYALAGGVDQEVSNVYAYPVPWSPNSGNPSLGTLSDGIRFTNVPSEGRIRIFDVAGELVRSLTIPPGNNGTVAWDVTTGGGRAVASGVYIWVVESGPNKKTGKLMVIR